jgi:hypothetical protein
MAEEPAVVLTKVVLGASPAPFSRGGNGGTAKPSFGAGTGGARGSTGLFCSARQSRWSSTHVDTKEKGSIESGVSVNDSSAKVFEGGTKNDHH